MTIFKTKEFARWARKEGLRDSALCDAVSEIANGLYQADVGGGLLKKRIARPGQGKSGGFRVLVAAKVGSHWFFIYGFAKNERSNLNIEEVAALKKLASVLLALMPQALIKAQRANELIEVDCDG